MVKIITVALLLVMATAGSAQYLGVPRNDRLSNVTGLEGVGITAYVELLGPSPFDPPWVEARVCSFLMLPSGPVLILCDDGQLFLHFGAKPSPARTPASRGSASWATAR